MKKTIIILSAVALTILVVGGYLYTQKSEGVLGGSAIIADATLYPLFPSGATKQVILDVRDAQGAFLDVSMTASTTASVLNWYYEFTNDNNCGFNASPTACTWYLQDGTTVTSNILTAHASTTVNHTWTRQSTSTANKRIDLGDVNAKFIRTTFTATGATSTITIQQGVKI